MRRFPVMKGRETKGRTKHKSISKHRRPCTPPSHRALVKAREVDTAAAAGWILIKLGFPPEQPRAASIKGARKSG